MGPHAGTSRRVAWTFATVALIGLVGLAANTGASSSAVPNPCLSSPTRLVAHALGVPSAEVLSSRSATTGAGLRDCIFCAVPASAHAGKVSAAQCDVTTGALSLTVNFAPPPGLGAPNAGSGGGVSVTYPAGIGDGYLVADPGGEHFVTFGHNGYPCRVTTIDKASASALLPLARYIYVHAAFCS